MKVYVYTPKTVGGSKLFVTDPNDLISELELVNEVITFDGEPPISIDDAIYRIGRIRVGWGWKANYFTVDAVEMTLEDFDEARGSW